MKLAPSKSTGKVAITNSLFPWGITPMDTVEELNGTYFYDGLNNLTAYELLFWILVDETENQLGIKDIIGVASVILGNNSVDVPSKPITATKLM